MKTVSEQFHIRDFQYKLFQIPGSLRSWCYILNKSMSEYTPRAQRILEGVTRRAAAERRPVRKATPIPQEVMRRALLRLVRGYQSVWDIPLPEFRACVALILQFHHFTRLGDLDELRACHISRDVVGGTQVLKVIYPKRKNDQERLGSESLLFAEESDICPVKLISLYFTRSGFRFFDGRCVDTNFVFCRTNCVYTSTGKQTVSDGRFAISVGTLLRDIQRICSGAGYGGKIGRKSGKMAGVSAACDAGLSDEALRDKGRWRSTEMSQHYRQHTTKYLHALGSCISLDGNHNGLQAARQGNVPIFRNCVLQRNLATPPPPLSARETSPVHTPVRNLPRPVFAQPPPRPAPRPSPAPARSPPTPISRRFRQPPPPLPQATKISASARLFHTPRSYGARAATGTLHNIQLVSPFNQASHFIDDTVYHPTGFRRGGAAIRSWLQ